MNRLILVCLFLGLLLSACLPSSQSQEYPTPVSETDLQATAAILSQQTLQALPTSTSLPSEAPVILTPSETATQPTATETGVPALLTLTATLLAGTPTAGTAVTTMGTLPTQEKIAGTPSSTIAPPTVDGTPQPLFYGTQPPALPSGTLSLFNKANADVYISLRCVTKDGYVTILEYPVKKNINVNAPAGKYTYIAWVGGRQFDGEFSLDKEGFITITFFKSKITIKKN